MPTPAGQGTNEFRCNACGRWFNSQAELSVHEVECRVSKTATEAGRRDLKAEDSATHEKNDHDSTKQPFQHGTKSEEARR